MGKKKNNKTIENNNDALKYEYISTELDSTINQEYNARIALDTKLFSALGVILAILTILCSNMSLPSVIDKDCVYEIIVKYILFSSGLIFVIIGIVKLFVAASPKDYKAFDLGGFLELNPKQYSYEQLLKVSNKKKNEIINNYHDVNQIKAKGLKDGVLWSIIGLIIYIVFNNIILKFI